MNNLAYKLIKLAVVIFAVGIVLRLFGFNDLNTIPGIGMAPSAFHRITDTLLFFSIAISLAAMVKSKPE